MKDSNQILRGLIAVVVLAVVIGGIVVFSAEDEVAENTAIAPANLNTTTTPPATTQTPESEIAAEATGVQAYENGSFATDASYSSPGGQAEMNVAITLENDTIQGVTVTSLAGNPTSEDYKERFAEAIIEVVTGVNLDEADVDTVAGASLTSRSFNQALDVLRAEAAR